ncbi:MAG: hypothetical protein INR71_09820, partial [Terriglobus roseus]|nr:hypothetical protein [Terriglobus roseus]
AEAKARLLRTALGPAVHLGGLGPRRGAGGAAAAGVQMQAQDGLTGDGGPSIEDFGRGRGGAAKKARTMEG